MVEHTALCLQSLSESVSICHHWDVSPALARVFVTVNVCEDLVVSCPVIGQFCLYFFLFSSQGVTISLNTTSGMVTSFELSDNTNDQSGEQESEYEQGEDELVYHKSDGSELYAHEYPEEGQYEGHDAELAGEHVAYVEEPEEGPLYSDEVLDIEVNEPLDEFTVSLSSLYGRR